MAHSPLQSLLDFQPVFSGPFIVAPFPQQQQPLFDLGRLPSPQDVVIDALRVGVDLAAAIFGASAPVRTIADSPGNVVPTPARTLSETASFPVGASAQVPILPGSRLDPFGFVRPSVGRTAYPDGLRA